MNRAFLTKLHLAVAAFMFPAVLMFLVTGGLYTWGSKGEWHEETVQVSLDRSIAEMDAAALEALAASQLKARGLARPSGELSVETGEGASLGWTGARTDIAIAATDTANVADVTIKQASLHRWLVQLHKAKGSTIFKVYATLLAAALFLLVASGLVMGLQVKSLRRLTGVSSIVGAAAFVGFVLMG